MNLPAAHAQNARRYLEVSACGWVLVLALLAVSHPQQDISAWYLAAIAVSLLVCIACAMALIVGVYRRSNAMRAAGESFDRVLAASRRYSNQNGVGSLLMFAGVVLQTTHVMFGVREFTGEWLVTMLCFGAGFLVQMHSQAEYLRALG